jgi:hypothetical protein
MSSSNLCIRLFTLKLNASVTKFQSHFVYLLKLKFPPLVVLIHILSFNIYRNRRTQQMSVLVLLCTSYTTCFGPYWWSSSGGFHWYTRNRMHNSMIKIFYHIWSSSKISSNNCYTTLRNLNIYVYLFAVSSTTAFVWDVLLVLSFLSGSTLICTV